MELAVYGYCGRDSLPEQVASIRSFLKNVGRPLRYVVVSDGSLGPADLRILSRIAPCVEVVELGDLVRRDLPGCLHPYVENNSMGRKLAVIMSMPLDVPCLYSDSDVLFFAGAGKHLLDENKSAAPASYLSDCQFVGDSRLIRSEQEKENSANAGFVLVRAPLNWSLACARFSEMEGAPMLFTEQTMVHLTLRDNQAEALDVSRFVLQLDDQFDFFDRNASASVAMRHYVGPVRHKFWNAVF